MTFWSGEIEEPTQTLVYDPSSSFKAGPKDVRVSQTLQVRDAYQDDDQEFFGDKVPMGSPHSSLQKTRPFRWQIILAVAIVMSFIFLVIIVRRQNHPLWSAMCCGPCVKSAEGPDPVHQGALVLVPDDALFAHASLDLYSPSGRYRRRPRINTTVL